MERLVQAVGAPARATRATLESRRRPIWLACWVVLWMLILWDVYLSLDRLEGNTWSEVLRAASGRNPFLPWFFGAFLTHLFHHRDDLRPLVDRDAAQTLMVVFSLIFLALWGVGVELEGWLLSAVAFFGMVAGYLFWPKLRQGEWHW